MEEKLIITAWFLEQFELEKELNIDLSPYNPEFLEFIRSSPAIYHLYEEDDGKLKIIPHVFNIHFSLHAIGASAYALLVTAAICVHDFHEEKVAWITGIFFLLFSFLGYITGTYFPPFSMFKGWVLLWNPFLRQTDYIEKLHVVRFIYYFILLRERIKNMFSCVQRQAVRNYADKKIIDDSPSLPDVSDKKKLSRMRSLSSQKRRRSSTLSPARAITTTEQISSKEKLKIQSKIDRFFEKYFLIRGARENPKLYLRVVSHIYMTVELIALMSPLVAMGIQWVTALCHSTPALTALVSVFSTMGECLWNRDFACSALKDSCIMTQNSTEMIPNRYF